MRTVGSLGGLVERILECVRSGTLGAGFHEPVQRGSASGSVVVVADPAEEGALLLRVALAVMRVPDEGREAFYRRLLGLNQGFHGRAAFSVDDDDVVWLAAGRPTEDLDPSEIIDLVLWTSEQADHFDDLLLEEFGHDYGI